MVPLASVPISVMPVRRIWCEGEVNSLARIWKVPVMKKRPPFCRVKSWQKKRKRDRQLKMMDRIIRAWTA